MVGHGICSSGLFCAVNIYYERSGSRLFLVNRGLLRVLPVFTLLFFILCACNIAAPPTINLMSEFTLFGSILKYNNLIFLALPVGSYMRALFTLYLFSYSQHGKNYFGLGSGVNFSVREYNLLVVHIIPVNFLIFSVDYFLILY